MAAAYLNHVFGPGLLVANCNLSGGCDKTWNEQHDVAGDHRPELHVLGEPTNVA